VKTSDFDYELPKDLIAQYPAERRDESRLLVVRREGGPLEHRRFREIGEYLTRGDVLVVNESRVIPARLLGKRSTGGQAEMFLLRDLGDGRWEVLVRPAARIREGSELSFGDGKLTARVEEALPDGKRVVSLSATAAAPGGGPGVAASVEAAIGELGAVPLPPYIDREAEPLDDSRYQTVYARVPGAVAAPTAGLHFTGELLDGLESAGVAVARLTLHVGIGTFRPVAVEDPDAHVMESERYEVRPAAARAINSAKDAGGRVIAVGTTSVRTLESVADESGRVHEGTGSTDLFIRPPYEFRCVDVLLTNFHLPKSSLLMLVSAFAGRERTLAAYAEAVRERYRFYSYGDAMLIL
jgi:S-adenosylmethionine:tRNA ribosyltransferase-isomerase